MHYGVLIIVTLTVRKVPDEVHRALRMRAAQHGRSTAAEVRAILEDAVKPGERVRMGDVLAKIGRDAGLTNEDIDFINKLRDRTPANPMKFE